MKKLNEDISITDPALMQQYASGQKQLLDKDTQINALQKQIANIQAAKIPIQKALAAIESKAGIEQQKKDVALQKQSEVNQKAAQQAPQQPAVESILVDSGQSLLEELIDTYTYLKNHGGSIEDIILITKQIKEEKERFSGIGSVRDVDRRNWYEKPENQIPKPAPPKQRKPREKRMTKREYERELKDIVSSLKGDEMEINHSIMYDMAENLIYQDYVRDYVTRRWIKDQLIDNPWNDKDDLQEPSKQDLIEIITNDLEMFESHNPMSIDKFYDMSEAFVELVGQDEKDEEEFIHGDYVFYVKVNDEEGEFIGKIYKIRPDGDWYGIVKKGTSNTFEKISYEPEYDEMDIIEFLGQNYDSVEIIDRFEYNDFIEDEVDEDVIGGSNWPTNSL